MLVTYVKVGLPLESVSMMVRGVDIGRGVLVMVAVGTPTEFVSVIVDARAYAGGVSLIKAVTVVCDARSAAPSVITDAFKFSGRPPTIIEVIVVAEPAAFVSVRIDVQTFGAPGNRIVTDVVPTLVGIQPGRPGRYSSVFTFVVDALLVT